MSVKSHKIPRGNIDLHQSKVRFHELVVRVGEGTKLVVECGCVPIIDTTRRLGDISASVIMQNDGWTHTFANRIHGSTREPCCDVNDRRLIRGTCEDVGPLRSELFAAIGTDVSWEKVALEVLSRYLRGHTAKDWNEGFGLGRWKNCRSFIC